MDLIRVVHITENPIAGAPINLCKAQNKWSEGKIHSRHIAMSDRNENRVFDSDLLTTNPGHEVSIWEAIRGADILHFHNFYQEQDLFRRYPRLWREALKKKRVIQIHTQRDIGWMDIEAGLRDPETKKIVIAQYHPRQYPECEVVQNVVDIFDERLMPRYIPYSKPRVVYSPSRINAPGWDNKGYNETAPILQRLVNEGVIEAEIIFDHPHDHCLKRKQIGNIAIDEVITGSYHLCSLETLSQGLVTIANLDLLQIQTLCQVTGSLASELPWVYASQDSLDVILRALTKPDAELERRQAYSRAWMERYWHPKDVVAKFERIYRDHLNG